MSKDGKKEESRREESGAPEERGIFDTEVLRQVTAEIQAEERGEKPEERIELPELHAPPKHNPYLWLFRQVKRLFIIIGVVYLAYQGVTFVLDRFRPLDYDIPQGGSVPLPKAEKGQVELDRKLSDKLKEGRRLLASSNEKMGLAALERLALESPASRQGQKAMLTLATTYRFQGGDKKAAARWYRKFLSTNPKSREVPPTMTRFGSLLEEMGRTGEARDLYEELLARFPGREPHTTVARRALERLGKIR